MITRIIIRKRRIRDAEEIKGAPREKVLSMALMLVMLVLGILCFLTPLSTLVGVQYLAFGCLAIYGAVMVVRYIGSEHKKQIFTSGRSGLFFTQCGGAAGVDVPVSRSGGGNDVFYLLYCAGSAVGIYGN